MRDLGLMGESTFTLWCGEAGLIPNGSNIDKTGWDFFVEFPFNCIEELSSDMHPSPIECKVQVKATDNKKRKLQIKLSNLRRLVTAPLPTFILFIEFDGTDFAKDAFLVHIDSALTDKVLKKIRHLEINNNKTDFNKCTMTVSYNDSHRLETIDGPGLKKSIIKYIPDGLDKYVTQKTEHLKTTGFESGAATLTFTTTSKSQLHELIELSIGKKDSVIVDSCVAHRTRFGIPEKSPFIQSETGTLSMTDLKPHSRGRITFRENKLSPPVIFDADLYVSAFNKYIDKKLKTIRIVCELLEMVFTPHTGKATFFFTLKNDLRHKINVLMDAFRFISKLTKQGYCFDALLEFDNLPKLNVSIPSMDSEVDINRYVLAIECATETAIYFDLLGQATISSNELFTQTEYIIQYNELTKTTPDKISINFSVDDIDFDVSKNICGLALMTSPLGDCVVGLLISFFGNITKQDDHIFNFIPDNMNIEHKITSQANTPLPAEDINNLFDELSEKYDAKGFTVVTMSHNIKPDPDNII